MSNAEQAARELAQALYERAISNPTGKQLVWSPDDAERYITQALKRYGNERLEEAASKLTTTIMSNNGTLTEVHTEIRNLKETV